MYRTKQRTSMAGQAIKAYRHSHGITQKQLATELGVEARTLRMYETGERALENITDLQRIAVLLAIDPEELGLASKKQTPDSPAQIYEVVERVWLLIPQARFVEAHKTIDTLLRSLHKPTLHENPQFLHAYACALNVAGYVKSIVCRTSEITRIIQHFQDLAQIARALDDQTLLNIALSHHGDMLRKQGDIPQSILYLETARTNTPLAHITARCNNARLLGRAYLYNADNAGFEQSLLHAEELAHTASPPTTHTFTLCCLGMIYAEAGHGYGRMGKLEKSLAYLERAETFLPPQNLWDMLLKASRAEALIYAGEITKGMPFAVEVAHLAQMYGHQCLLERLYRLQCYLDDRALLMSRASRSLNDVLHGAVER